ncbi:hypothetical protein [Dyella tabacisoli]|uniref:Uncharacterized protein n=1 Tax=Dyella tabacisoli TaxID=2282381 RepID=A0A369UHR8_9GAMM|nr:hypothetical protein DVJ77_18365 [Dyella tabacisoli]
MAVGFDLLAYIQDVGDGHTGPGGYAGTRGENKRLEGFMITLAPWTRDLEGAAPGRCLGRGRCRVDQRRQLDRYPRTRQGD